VRLAAANKFDQFLTHEKQDGQCGIWDKDGQLGIIAASVEQ
jgi:hypothetical protein